MTDERDKMPASVRLHRYVNSKQAEDDARAYVEKYRDENDDLTTLHVTDQHDAEVRDTAGLVGAYFKALQESGVPEEAATNMVQDFNAMVLARHFGIDVNQAAVLDIFKEGME